MNTDDQNIFRGYLGPRVVEARQALGMSQTDLCEHLNINRPTLSKIELGNTGCDVYTLVLLSRALRVNVEYFLPEIEQSGVSEETVRGGLELLKRGNLMIARAERILSGGLGKLIG